MIKFLLWLHPVHSPLALILYPIVWLILLPFRLVGVVVKGVLELVCAVVMLPALLLRKLAVH